MEVAYYTVLEDRKKLIRKRLRIRKISKAYGVPRNTLNQRILGRVKGFGHKSGGENVPKLFTIKEEQQLEKLLLAYSDAGFPFTPMDLRVLAHDYAQLLGVENLPRSGKLSRNWQRLFVKRHPEVSYMHPQHLSA